MWKRLGAFVGGVVMVVALVCTGAGTAAAASDVSLTHATLSVTGASYRLSRPFQPLPQLTPLPQQVENQLYSANWSGFIDGATVSSSSLMPDNATFNSVSSSWTVPTLEPSAPNSDTASWVGIGGVFGDSLLQVGTIEDFSGPTQQYTAFVEDYPNPALEVNAPVRPGDQLSAAVTESGGTWSVVLTDATRGWTTGSIDASTVYGQLGYTFDTPNTSSAEWITEDPTCGRSQCTFADFSPEMFTSVTDTADTAVSRTPVESIIVNAQGVPQTSVTPATVGSTTTSAGSFSNFTVARVVGTTSSPSPPGRAPGPGAPSPKGPGAGGPAGPGGNGPGGPPGNGPGASRP